MQFNFGGSQAI